tara:strand:+ start:309 stop:464 length:156 start_codon:yes stop_codon:yes gene_type:complete
MLFITLWGALWNVGNSAVIVSEAYRIVWAAAGDLNNLNCIILGAKSMNSVT